MNGQRVGLVIIAMSVLFGIAAFTAMSQLTGHTTDIGCLDTPQCPRIESVLNWSHLTVGIVFAALTLGIYLLVFSKSEQLLAQAIRRLEAEQDQMRTEHARTIHAEKLAAVLRILPPPDQRILKIIHEHEGITQNTLRIKAELSKAKVSQVLSDFEKRGIVRREQKGKTYALYLAQL